MIYFWLLSKNQWIRWQSNIPIWIFDETYLLVFKCLSLLYQYRNWTNQLKAFPRFRLGYANWIFLLLILTYWYPIKPIHFLAWFIIHLMKSLNFQNSHFICDLYQCVDYMSADHPALIWILGRLNQASNVPPDLRTKFDPHSFSE